MIDGNGWPCSLMIPFADDKLLYIQALTGYHQWDQGIHARYAIDGYLQDILLKFYMSYVVIHQHKILSSERGCRKM